MAGEGKSLKTTTMTSLSKDQQKVSKQTASVISSNLGKDLEQYSGQMVADLTPEFLSARQLLDSGVDESLDPVTKNVIEQLLSGEAAYDLSPATTEKYFEDSVKKPLLRTFDEEIAPRLQEGFAAQGATFSSRRGDATRKALEGLQAEMSSKLAEANYNNQALAANLADNAKNRQATGVSLAEQYANRNTTRATGLLSAAAPFQQREQDLLTAQYNEFLRTRAETSPYLQAALGYTGQSQTNTFVQPQSQGFDFGSLINAGATLGSAYLSY
jgi:hypothetical protein